MSVLRQKFRYRLLIGGAVMALPLLVGAAPGPAEQNRGGCDAGFRGAPPPHGPLGMGPGPMGMGPGEDRPPPFLRDLKLSEDQQDKVFAIMHAAAPALRDQSKAVRKSRDALRELSRSPQFSVDAATTLAQTQGKAESQLALLRTRMEHDVYALLTPDQRTQMTDRRHDMEAPRDEKWPRQ
jgi:periplasmic protein CpxP/Spy